MRLYATCDAGLEPTLAQELIELGIADAVPGSRGVAFGGDHNAVYRANLQSRVANRVLHVIGEPFEATQREALYDGIAAIDWDRYVAPGATIAVDVTTGASAMKHSAFVGQVVKDAVCDRLRSERGNRPSVDKENPDVPIAIRLVSDQVTVALDTSGARLHQRGYRTEAGPAPLRETLAAGILRLSGWRPGEPLLDPCCGAGTFVIEAAQIARGLQPGRARLMPGGRGFAFLKWRGHDPVAFERFVNELDERVSPRGPGLIVGSDVDGRVIEVAKRNARRAAVFHEIDFEARDLRAVSPRGEGGVVVINPPYGHRLGEVESLRPLYQALGDVLKQRFTGHTAYALVSDSDLAQALGLKPTARLVLHNGGIECRLMRFDLYAGTHRTFDGPDQRGA